MKISSVYVCPLRGIVRLEPPEPKRLAQAAYIARDLGLQKLYLPVLETALLGSSRKRVVFLNGLVKALDGVAEAGITAWVVALAHHVLGWVWPAPYLVSPVRGPKELPVFVDGRVRYLRSYDWWAEPSMVEKRIGVFRELLSSIHGHPANSGWLIMDRDLDWARPDIQSAEFVLRSFVSEVREREPEKRVYLGVGWQELLKPEITAALAREVNGLRVSGTEIWPPGIEKSEKPWEEVLLAVYLGALAQWLFGKPVEVEIGWRSREDSENDVRWFEAGRRLASEGLAGVSWFNLCDPDHLLHGEPPWPLSSGLKRSALLDEGLNPKDWVEDWLSEIMAVKPREGAPDFMDISPEEYVADTGMHFARLWGHFKEQG